MSPIDGNKWSDQYARLMFPVLVQRVEEASLSGTRQPFTYKELASLFGIHHRCIHWALGVIGHAIEQLDHIALKKWHVRIPPIELLVCGKNSKVPGGGGM